MTLTLLTGRKQVNFPVQETASGKHKTFFTPCLIHNSSLIDGDNVQETVERDRGQHV